VGLTDELADNDTDRGRTTTGTDEPGTAPTGSTSVNEAVADTEEVRSMDR